MGRPSKLTDAIRDAIAGAVRRGVHINVAAAKAGISTATYRNWMVRGELAHEQDGDIEEREVPYLAFFEAITRAQAENEAELVEEVRTAYDAEGNPKESKWFLERRYPERWGAKLKIDMRKQVSDELLAQLREGLSEGEYRKVLQVLLTGVGESGTGGAERESEDEDPDSFPLH